MFRLLGGDNLKRLVYAALVFSLIVNILLIYDRIENAKKLNTSWSNSIVNMETTIVVSIIPTNLLDRLDEGGLSTIQPSLWILSKQLTDLQLLPEGGRIVTFSTIQKVSTVTNYEHKLISKIEKDVNSSNKISSNDIEQLSKINKAWEKMLATLQREVSEIYPFYPIFRAEQWKAVLDDASKELDGLKLEPLPDSPSQK